MTDPKAGAITNHIISDFNKKIDKFFMDQIIYGAGYLKITENGIENVDPFTAEKELKEIRKFCHD